MGGVTYTRIDRIHGGRTERYNKQRQDRQRETAETGYTDRGRLALWGLGCLGGFWSDLNICHHRWWGDMYTEVGQRDTTERQDTQK